MTSIKSLLFVLVLLPLYPVQAQSPNWTVNAQEFQYSMTIVAFLSVDDRVLTGEKDRVAAFVNAEVRGVATPIYIASADRYLAYLTVYANTGGEDIGFRLYDHSTGQVSDVVVTLPFTIDGQHGNSFQAFSIASPALNPEAEIMNFHFTGVDSIQTEISDGLVDVVVPYDQNVFELTPEFLLSDGAKLYLDRTAVATGGTVHDFSQPVTYTVLSEDQSVLKTWVITVRNQETSDGGFACTNVITANNDGANDYWIIIDAFKYRHHKFSIFDVNGRVLHESVGYNNDWNGTYKGVRVARGKYYFVISDPDTNAVIHGNILVLY